MNLNDNYRVLINSKVFQMIYFAFSSILNQIFDEKDNVSIEIIMFVLIICLVYLKDTYLSESNVFISRHVCKDHPFLKQQCFQSD